METRNGPTGISKRFEQKVKADARPEDAAVLAKMRKAIGEGMGVGGERQGVGGVDRCVCPECGTAKDHDRGTPCKKVKCPECGAAMAPALEKEEEITLVSKDCTVENAENGILMRVNETWEIPEKEWHRYLHRNFVFKNIDELISVLKNEMKLKKGDTIALSEFGAYTEGKEVSETEAVTKRELSFAVGEGDGHIHLARGEITDKKDAGGGSVKVFSGSTLPDKAFVSISGGGDEEVVRHLKPHSHKFQIKLTGDDEAGWRIYGTTDAHSAEGGSGHAHPVDILDIRSIPVSNTPDA